MVIGDLSSKISQVFYFNFGLGKGMSRFLPYSLPAMSSIAKTNVKSSLYFFYVSCSFKCQRSCLSQFSFFILNSLKNLKLGAVYTLVLMPSRSCLSTTFFNSSDLPGNLVKDNSVLFFFKHYLHCSDMLTSSLLPYSCPQGHMAQWGKKALVGWLNPKLWVQYLATPVGNRNLESWFKGR